MEKRRLNDWIELIEKLAKKNGNSIPCVSVLEELYPGATNCIKDNPDKFKHLKQDYFAGKTPKYWKKYTEKLAKKNRGIIPKSIELPMGLKICINKHPEVFNGIKQYYGKGNKIRIIGKSDVTAKTPKYWKKYAVDLAETNGGIIPRPIEIPNALKICIRNHPEVFKGMKQYYGRSKRIIIIGKEKDAQ
jgi:hypothetical protein